MNLKSLQETSNQILLLRTSGKIEEALDLSLEAVKQFPRDYFYPKIAGDLYFVQGKYDAAAELFVEIFKRMPYNEKLFADFARRYYRLKRVWPSHKILEYATLIAREAKKGCFNSRVTINIENLIKNDLPRDIEISEHGQNFRQ